VDLTRKPPGRLRQLRSIGSFSRFSSRRKSRTDIESE